MPSTFNDLQCGVDVSNYKWLSESLKTAQQQFISRPDTQCFIKDDTITPTTVYADPGQPLNGAVVTAPDGALLVIGRTTGGNLGFWKITAGSVLANWQAAPNVVLATSGSFRSDLNASINVSDYIAGSYTIDVYYFVGATPTPVVTTKRSTNAGVSFSGATSLVSYSSDTVAYVSAGKPYYQTNGTTNGIVFFAKPIGATQAVVAYSYYTGSAWVNNIQWNIENVETGEWWLNSLDNYYNPYSGVYYVYFSGYHTMFESTNGNFSIYYTKLVQRTASITTDIWSPAVEVLSSLSSASQNENSFTLPKVNYDGALLWLTFKAVTVQDVKEDGTVTTNTQFFQSYSSDFQNFTYPWTITSATGSIFTDTNGYSFAKQGSYYYLAGSGKLWQFTQNSVVADVTSDLLKYKITESAGAPSSITLSIGNQNGQWIGPSPTQTGASAISSNKKIFLYQGFYDADGVPQYVPRNTYFIDDVKQMVSSNRNDLTIAGRDWYKKLRTTVSRFQYNYKGPDYYYDSFDGSTIGNWNQSSGTWVESNGFIQPSAAPALNVENLITLGNINLKNYGYMARFTVKLPDLATATQITIYPWYLDGGNFLRLRITSLGNGTQTSWFVEKYVNGVLTLTSDSENPTTFFASTNYATVWITCYNYSLFTFNIVGGRSLADTYAVSSQPLANLRNSSGGIYNLSGLNATDTTTFAFGCNGFVGMLGNFQLVQFSQPNSIKEVATNLGVKSGILSYKFQDALTDDLFYPSRWTGFFTSANRVLRLATTFSAFYNVTQIADAEMKFTMRVIPNGATTSYAAVVGVRSQSSADFANCYYIRIGVEPDPYTATSFTYIRLYNNSSGFGFVDMRYTGFGSGSVGIPSSNNLQFDITKDHEYRVVFNKQWITIFIDDELVLSFFDNNSNVTYTTGYFGIAAEQACVVYAQNFKSTIFYSQISKFTLNPGDDVDNSLRTLTDVVKAWNFSDLFGRFKSLVLSVLDPTKYVYQGQLLSQITDQSSKEYANQVTVVGLGVSAIARDSESFGANVIVRDEVIVDYKIKTLKEAQNRATYELTNYNKFNSQSDPKQLNNLGSELFDVVTIINTDSDTDEESRVYNQDITLDGSTNEYSVSLGAGEVT